MIYALSHRWAEAVYTTTSLPFLAEERAQIDRILQRLRRFRETRPDREIVRDERTLLQRLTRVMQGRRTEAVKAKLRWFTETEEFEKLQAQMEVKRSIGRQGLWTEEADSKAMRADFVTDRDSGQHFVKFHKESMQHWKHQIDPLLADERPYFEPEAPGGKESRRVTKAHRKLRVLEGQAENAEEELLLTAQSLVEEIKLLCENDSEAPHSVSDVIDATP